MGWYHQIVGRSFRQLAEVVWRRLIVGIVEWSSSEMVGWVMRKMGLMIGLEIAWWRMVKIGRLIWGKLRGEGVGG